MTAIAAVVRQRRSSAPVRGHLGSLRAALSPLGRDGSTALDLGPVGFVHCHSSGFTPHDQYDQQPLRLADGRLTIVVDCRVDNREEIIRHLELPRKDADRLADTDLFGRVWQRDGVAGLKRIVGPFAAIGWDQRRDEVVAVRDPLGQRTLHYHEGVDHLIIASSPTGIHACGVEPRVDLIKLVDALLLDYSEADRTFYENISRLPAGMSIHIRPGGPAPRVETHHDLFDVEPLVLATDDEYLEAADEVFSAACAAMLRTTSTPSLALSGGLDSILVATRLGPHLADRGERLRAFTSVPAHPVPDGTSRVLDESPLVDAFLARHPTIDHRYLRSAGRGIYDHLDAVITAGGHPPRNPANLYWVHEVAERTREAGGNVFFTGGMGNATIGWAGDDLLPTLVRHGRLVELSREVIAASPRGARLSGARALWKQIGRTRCSPRLLRLIDRLRHQDLSWSVHSALRTDLPELPDVERRIRDRGFDPEFRGTDDDPQRRLIEGPTRMLGEQHNVFLAIHGVEVRDPTSDRRVVELSRAIPRAQFRSAGVDRWLQRRMLVPNAPDEIAWSRQRGRQAADTGARLTEVLPMLHRDLNDASNDELLRSILDLNRLRSIVANRDSWPDSLADSRAAGDLFALTRSIATIRFVEQVRSPLQRVAHAVDSTAGDERVRVEVRSPSRTHRYG